MKAAVWISIGVLSLNAVVGCKRLLPTMSGTARFIVIIPSGFKGEARVVDDPSRKLDFSKVNVIRVRGGLAEVPVGFFTRSSKGETVIEGYTIEELQDETGKRLSMGMSPKRGQVAVLKISGRFGPDELEKTGEENNAYLKIGIAP